MANVHPDVSKNFFNTTSSDVSSNEMLHSLRPSVDSREFNAQFEEENVLLAQISAIKRPGIRRVEPLLLH